MVNEKQFEDMGNLMTEYVKLERRLFEVDKAIKEKRNGCHHLELKMGYLMDDLYNCCLICGARDIMPTEYSVDASNYLPEYDVVNDEEFNEKFHTIQTMACGILNNHNERNVEDSVLVSELNSIISSAIKEEEAKKLVK